ncbi:MAG: ABC transporter ATP-binding protein [Campylobacteraceae bacterium]|nr:ABC transporter ATP-binding protein [Campylobacteraceae bacterium]
MSFYCKNLKIETLDSTLVNINFHIKHSLALVGESGSGKSLTLKALLGLTPKSLKVSLDYEATFKLERGKTVAFVPQNPFTALSPLTKIEDQFFHKEAAHLMDLVKLKPSLLKSFPPELSGGQLQRIVIAIALSANPRLVLLDEPTTALDTETRSSILEMLRKLQEELGFVMLFVTHDMHSAMSICEDIAILQKGLIVEEGSMEKTINHPSHSYTKALLEAGFANRGFRT